MSDGAKMIANERERQIAQEGWTAEHDEGHATGELIEAAECYLRTDHYSAEQSRRAAPVNWPWESTAWKPTTRVRDLVKAGALIAAEIDRLLRTDPGAGG